MYEVSVACKYLLPRRRQLSVSIISLISTLVISLVVWLIVVFFSVTDGLERSWIDKLTALTAPIRVTPTKDYYHSYYYLIDSLSQGSNFSSKTILEKLEAPLTDPYDPELDEEIPLAWPKPDLNADGALKDPVKSVYGILNGMDGIKPHEFEVAGTQLHLRFIRSHGTQNESEWTFPAFISNLEPDHERFTKTMSPISAEDLQNDLLLLGIVNHPQAETLSLAPQGLLRERLGDFFKVVTLTNLKIGPSGWLLPRHLELPDTSWEIEAVYKNERLFRILIPAKISDLALSKKRWEERGYLVKTGKLQVKNQEVKLFINGEETTSFIPPTIVAGTDFKANVVPDSIEQAKRAEDLKFKGELDVQGTKVPVTIAFSHLKIADFRIDPASSTQFWAQVGKQGVTLPSDAEMGEGILVPKQLKDSGVLLGERGFLTYYSPTASILLEQQLPIFVAGFYDPGIIPVGGKYILANRKVPSLIRAAKQEDDTHLTNGINVQFGDYKQADQIKERLIQALQKEGIDRYWKVSTYKEFEFSKDIIQELQSQKQIFMLIAIVIILVACSNIISMLIILVNDKKSEIGILRSMGATSKSIAFIFGFAGAMIGIAGSLFGIMAAVLTLSNLQSLIAVISKVQGYDMFNTAFYGDIMPQELSYEALLFVLVATMILSLLAGIVPAVKACLLKPANILRSTES